MYIIKYSCRLPIVVSLLLLVPFLSGCTKEKAQALYGAAKAFEVEANIAIDTYEALFRAAAKGPEISEKEHIASFLKQARAKVKQGDRLDSNEVMNRLRWKNKEEKTAESIAGEFKNIRYLYSELRASLTRLPEGNFLARQEVACSAEIAVRLVQGLLNYAENIKNKPIGLIKSESDLTNMLNEAIKNGNEVEQVRVTNLLMNVAKRGDELNKNAVKQTIVAAEAGMRVVDLAHHYNELTLSEILTLVNQGLEIANSVKGIEIGAALTRVADIKLRLESDEYLKNILSTEFRAKGTSCNPNKEI